MPSRRDVLLAAAAAMTASACRAQSSGPARPRTNLYNCEGCEAVFQRRAATLASDVDIARGEVGEPMILEGVVTLPDGRTPAPGVILYLHQTNAKGLYANGSSEDEWSRRHGRLRGWAVTDTHGRYRFRTIKPAPYPSRELPAHIHLMVGEPGKRPYYIDDIVFDGEFGVTPTYRARQEFRGGSGIVKLSHDRQGGWRAVRNIRLERHP